MADTLERAFNKYFSKEFPEEINASDEDYIDEDENPRKRKRNRSGRGMEKYAKMTGKSCLNNIFRSTFLFATTYLVNSFS